MIREELFIECNFSAIIWWYFQHSAVLLHSLLGQIRLNPFFSKLRTDLRISFWVGSRPITIYNIRGEMYWKWKSTEWMSTWCHQLLSRKRISRGCSCVLCGYSSWLGTRSLCIDVIYVSWRQAPVLFAGIIFKSFTTVISHVILFFCGKRPFEICVWDQLGGKN